MTKRAILLVQMLLLSLGTYAAAPIPDLAYWKFDEDPGLTTASDSSGNNLAGALVGSAEFINGGIVGNAIRLQSCSQINMGDILDLNDSSFTLAVWVKVTPGQTNDMPIISRVTPYQGLGYSLNAGLNIGQGPDSSAGAVFAYGSAGGLWYAYAPPAGSEQFHLNDGQWHHLVAVKEIGSERRLYVDGVQSATAWSGWGGAGGFTGLNYPYADPATNFYVGGNRFSPASDYFEGYLDELMVFGRALSTAEVQDLYNSYPSTAPVPDASGILAHWKFDESSGLIVRDSSLNHLDGTVAGNGVLPGWGSGVRGNALWLSGSNVSYVNMGNVLNMGESNFTIAVWVRLQGPYYDDIKYDPFTAVAVSKRWYGTQTGFDLTASEPVFNTLTQLWDYRSRFYTATEDVAGAAYSNLSDYGLNDGQWHHLVAVFENGVQKRLHLDGGPAVGSGPAGSFSNGPNYPFGPFAPFIIGGVAGGEQWGQGAGYGWFRGSIDELIVYGRALSEPEVSALYSSY